MIVRMLALQVAAWKIWMERRSIQRFAFQMSVSELDFGLRLGAVSKLLSRWSGVPPIADSSHQTQWVAGASMMIRREVFDAIGLLDENYFMYFEEVDFCLRAYRAGWTCWYVAAESCGSFRGSKLWCDRLQASTQTLTHVLV